MVTESQRVFKEEEQHIRTVHMVCFAAYSWDLHIDCGTQTILINLPNYWLSQLAQMNLMCVCSKAVDTRSGLVRLSF